MLGALPSQHHGNPPATPPNRFWVSWLPPLSYVHLCTYLHLCTKLAPNSMSSCAAKLLLHSCCCKADAAEAVAAEAVATEAAAAELLLQRLLHFNHISITFQSCTFVNVPRLEFRIYNYDIYFFMKKLERIFFVFFYFSFFFFKKDI